MFFSDNRAKSRSTGQRASIRIVFWLSHQNSPLEPTWNQNNHALDCTTVSACTMSSSRQYVSVDRFGWGVPRDPNRAFCWGDFASQTKLSNLKAVRLSVRTPNCCNQSSGQDQMDLFRSKFCWLVRFKRQVATGWWYQGKKIYKTS